MIETQPGHASPSAEGRYLLALDIGSTTVRAVLFDLRGAPVGDSYREPPVHYPGKNRAEIDVNLRWDAVQVVIREALGIAAIAPGQIVGIGLTGLQHALTPIDAEGRPLARAMLWMDQRCQPQVEWMAREHGDILQAEVGATRASTTWSAPKLRWIYENQPELIERTFKFMPTKDYIRFKLTGAIETDPSEAGGTMLFNRQTGDWSRPMMAMVGVPVEKMPVIKPSSTVVGGVTAAAAAATGLQEGTPVVIGGGDTKCTRLGANTESTGGACLYIGTAAWLAAPNRRRNAFSATATTGAALKWITAVVGLSDPNAPGDGYASLLAEADRVRPGAGGLLFLPHLMGERGPVPSAKATATFFGLTLGHGRAEMARAVLEGCAFHLRSILETVSEEPLQEITLVGGGAKSPIWRQIIADVTGVRLLTPRVLEAGALGAAIFAGIGVGLYPDEAQAAAQLVQIVERREPDPVRHAFYSRVYPHYLELEERVAPMYGQAPVDITEEEASCAS
jgi:xylulokinase